MWLIHLMRETNVNNFPVLKKNHFQREATGYVLKTEGPQLSHALADAASLCCFPGAVVCAAEHTESIGLRSQASVRSCYLSIISKLYKARNKLETNMPQCGVITQV